MNSILSAAAIIAAAALLGSGPGASSVDAEQSVTPYPWPVKDSFAIMNTVSTLQFYGPVPGFHHGVDFRTPAGTKVYAPIGGKLVFEVRAIDFAGNSSRMTLALELAGP